MTKVVVINGNPIENSFCQQLGLAYLVGARAAGMDAKMVNLGDLQFDPVSRYGYAPGQPLEPDLQGLRMAIAAADHLVFVYPIWWGSVPAVMKGMLDRVFLPGFAFKYEKGAVFPKQLLKGKTARLLVTMDTPGWYFRFGYGAPAHKMMKRTVLGFCGVKPVRISEFSPMNKASSPKRQRWLQQANALGRRGL